MNERNNTQFRVRTNNQIRIPQIRVILNDGTNAGVMNTYDALKLAKEQSLDLVEINPTAKPPVCKIMDYGKFKYEEKKKLQAAKKKQVTQELKELTFRPATDENDLSHKVEQAKGFLSEGHKVKFTIRFRGREITHPQVGRDKMEWILQQLAGLIAPAPPTSLEGKFMSMIVSPGKQEKKSAHPRDFVFSQKGKSEIQAVENLKEANIKYAVYYNEVDYAQDVEILNKTPLNQRSFKSAGLLIKKGLVKDCFCI